jgi:hypothetical protein
VVVKDYIGLPQKAVALESDQFYVTGAGAHEIYFSI